MKKLLALALALTITGAYLNAQETPPAGPPQGEPPTVQETAGGRPEGGNQRRQLSPEQMQERQAKRFRDAAAELKEMYDANQDGVLDAQERAKLDADLETAKRLQRYLMVGQVINEIDTDRNLEISDEEVAKISEAMKKMRPGMMGPGGRGPGMGQRGQQGQRGGRPNGPRGNRQGPPQGQAPTDGEEPPAPPTEE